MTGILRVPRTAALWAIAAIITAASLSSFAESFRGLYDWAREHGLSGAWAAAWPLQVDTFIAVGELALFVALADRWSVRSRIGAWAVTLVGLVVSVAGNVGHVAGHSLTSRATAAVPPLAAAAALAVGLGVLKRVVEAHHQGHPGTVPGEPSPARGGGVPGEPRRESRGSVPETVLPAYPGGVPALNGQPHPRRAAGETRGTPGKRARTRPGKRAPVTPESAELAFAPVLAEGRIPSLREVRRQLHLGTDRAREIREHLESVLART